MADRKISDLTALTAPAAGDYLPIVDISEAAAANKNKRITIEELFRGIPLGTAAAPSIAIEGDENTGIYSPGADQLAISTGGTGRLFVDASGNVGIGTGSPSNYANFVTLALADTSGAEIDFIKGSTTQGSIYNAGDIFYAGGSTSVPIALLAGGSERLRLTSTGALNFVGAGTAGSTQAVSFNGSAPINSLVIDSSGNVSSNTNTFFIDRANSRVGLGTSSPNKPLDIYTGSSDSEIRLQTNSGTEQNAYISLRNSGGKLDLYSVNGDIALNPGNNVAATFKADGKVGIGTTGPDTSLTISYSDSAFNPGIKVTNTSNTSASQAKIYAVNNSGEYIALVRNSDALGGGSALFSTGAAPLAFFTDSTERARIDSSGRLLVGTSSALNVEPFVAAQVQTESRYGYASIYRANDANGPSFYFIKSRAANAATGVSNNDVLGTIRFQGANGTDYESTAAWIRAEVDGEPQTSGDTSDLPGRLVFSTTADGASSPTERMRITSGGAVAIGTTSPQTSYMLTVAGDAPGGGAGGIAAKADGVGDANFYSSSTSIGYHFYGLGASSNVFYVENDGDVRNTNNSYGAVSDLKLKQDLDDASSQWEDIKAVRVRKFRFKSNPDGNLHIGVIAQELELVSPGLVDETIDRDAEGEDLGTVTKSVKYSVLYMKAVKALQEAMERIEALEAKVAALEAS